MPDTVRSVAPRHEAAGFAELSMVSLRRTVPVGDRSLPAGTRVTVVAAYRDGLGYEIESSVPFHAVVTVEAGDLMQ
jgi:hypothetical protein